MLGCVLDGRFTLIAKLGAGSMGTVYRARQRAMERDVAIKILRRDRAIDAASKARFLREARANSALVSPHTVTAFDFGESASGELFLAMELLEGESLGQRMTRIRRLPVAMAIDTARQALRSLAEAHAKGIVHRDLKPDNLFYARVLRGDAHEEIVKVVDFGVAKMLGEGMEPINAIETQAGTVFGTPRYMSPEQAQAKPLDGRSDLYSLAVLLYHMLTGRPPFTDDDAILVMARHIKSVPRPMREVAPEAGIPRPIEDVVLRTLSKKPSDRPENAEAMSAELLRALEASHGAAAASGAFARSPDAAAGSMAVAGASANAAQRRRTLGRGALIAAGALALALGAFFALSSRGPSEDAHAPPAAAPALGIAIAEPPSASATAPAPEALTPIAATELPTATPPPTALANARRKTAPTRLPRVRGAASAASTAPVAPSAAVKYGTLE